MHHPTDMIVHTHSLCYTSHGALAWLEREIAQWPIAPWAYTLTMELHLAPYISADNEITWDIPNGSSLNIRKSLSNIRKIPPWPLLASYYEKSVLQASQYRACKIVQVWVKHFHMYTIRPVGSYNFFVGYIHTNLEKINVQYELLALLAVCLPM